MNWNKFDCLIIVCIAAIAWGGLEVLHAFLPIRIIGLFGLLHFFKSAGWRRYSSYRSWRLIYSFWVLYIVCSLAWTPDVKSALLQAIHLVLIFGVLLLLQDSSKKAAHPLTSIILGWSAMVAITIPIALWELTTGNHLSSGSANEDLTISVGVLRTFAAVTFGNLNSYSVILCYALPFMMVTWMVKIPFHKIVRILSIVTIGIIVMNASRGCVLSMLFALLLFLIINSFSKGSVVKSIGLVVVIGVAVWFAIEYLQIDLFFQLLDRFEELGLESSREDVYNAGLNIAQGSYFLGNGVASTIPMLKSHYSGLNVLVTHSFYLEILIEYGIVFFILIFGRFYLSSINVFKSRSKELKYLASYIILTSPILFSVDDYYSGESAVWIYLFSIMLLEAISLDKSKQIW